MSFFSIVPFFMFFIFFVLVHSLDAAIERCCSLGDLLR